MQDTSLTMTTGAFTAALQHAWQSGAASGRIEGAIVIIIVFAVALISVKYWNYYQANKFKVDPKSEEYHVG